MVVVTTHELRLCDPAQADALVAGLGLPAAPVTDEGWFGALAPYEDEALLELLLARVRALGAPGADARAAFAARHEALVREAVETAVRRLGAVPSLEDAQLRFGARGLPEALALGVDGWVSGLDRAALAALATERVDAHLAQLAA